MKKVLLIAMAITLCAGAAMADHIGIYTDVVATSCTLSSVLPFPTVNHVYVVHRFTAGAKGSSWKVIDASGLIAASNTLLGTPQYLKIGEWNTGIIVGYAFCYFGDVPVMDLGFYAIGTPAVCASLTVVANPNQLQGEVVAIDCNDAEHVATGGVFHFNPNDTCLDCGEVATKQSTWGNVKALYR
jgi:hypothetical protein